MHKKNFSIRYLLFRYFVFALSFLWYVYNQDLFQCHFPDQILDWPIWIVQNKNTIILQFKTNQITFTTNLYWLNGDLNICWLEYTLNPELHILAKTCVRIVNQSIIVVSIAFTIYLLLSLLMLCDNLLKLLGPFFVVKSS